MNTQAKVTVAVDSSMTTTASYGFANTNLKLDNLETATLYIGFEKDSAPRNAPKRRIAIRGHQSFSGFGDEVNGALIWNISGDRPTTEDFRKIASIIDNELKSNSLKPTAPQSADLQPLTKATIAQRLIHLYDSVTATVDFDPKWDNGTGYLDAAVYDAPHGVYKFITEGALPGRRGLRVRVGDQTVVVFERGSGGTRVVYNANRDFKLVFRDLNGGENQMVAKGMDFVDFLINRAENLDEYGV